MAFDSRGPLEALTGLITGLGMDCQAGAPRGGPRVFGFVCLASQEVRRPTLKTRERRATYYTALCYRVDLAESGAELQLADYLDAYLDALLADDHLSNTSDMPILVDAATGNKPTYTSFGQQEYRYYPVMVTVIQHQAS